MGQTAGTLQCCISEWDTGDIPWRPTSPQGYFGMGQTAETLHHRGDPRHYSLGHEGIRLGNLFFKSFIVRARKESHILLGQLWQYWTILYTCWPEIVHKLENWKNLVSSHVTSTQYNYYT